MKTLFLILGLSFLLIGCKKDENEREPNTYTIEGHYLQDCNTPWENINLRFRIIRLYTFSVEVNVVGYTSTDENGYYRLEYQDPREFKRADPGELQIDFSYPTNPDQYYGVVEDLVPHKNLTVNYVTQPTDTAFFRTIGGGNLTSNDTLYISHEDYLIRSFVGPFDDNTPIDTFIYTSNFGRQSMDWSIGKADLWTMRERNSNFGNYGNSNYERNICSSVEIMIDLSNAK